MDACKTLYINEDNAHFYIGHPAEDMSLAGLNALVDRYAQSDRLAGILFNVNVQRALFDSRAWEPLYHDYDPDRGDDQPALAWLPPEQRKLRPGCHGRTWVHNLWLLKHRGLDHFAVWLERCRHHDVEGWLSVRMNDCHHNDSEDAFWHPTLWRDRPELRRASYRPEGWFEGAFDYGKPEVVNHHLVLLKEVTERYDLDGLEIDWVRWVRHFRPGSEERNASILTQVMRTARALTEAAALRLGHPVNLAARLPADLTNALTLGYDIPAWAREELVDLITLAPFFNQPFYDWRIDLWRAVLGDKITILCQPESLAHANPYVNGSGSIQDYRLHYGACAAALERGADGIYLFNDCYREGPLDTMSQKEPGQLDTLLTVAPDAERLREHPRRHMVSYPQISGPGMPTGSVLPIPIRRTERSFEFGRHHTDLVTLRIPLGPKPQNAPLRLILGFDAETPQTLADDTTLWLNSQPVESEQETWARSAKKDKSDRETDGLAERLPELVAMAIACDLPHGMVQDDTNVIELLMPRAPGNLVWAEIEVEELSETGDRNAR